MGIQRRCFGISDDQAAYLTERMGHVWEVRKAFKVCARCKLRRALRSRGWGRHSRVRTAVDFRCPKAKKPNRWRMHMHRWIARQQASKPTLDARWLLTEIQAVESEAKRLRIGAEDDRSWAFHPVARRYRRLIKRWWALPTIPAAVAADSPTRDLPLTRLGLPSSEANFGASRLPIYKLWWALDVYDCGLRADPLPELARKAAHALRKIRPDLFEGYTGSTVYRSPD